MLKEKRKDTEKDVGVYSEYHVIYDNNDSLVFSCSNILQILLRVQIYDDC